MTQTPVPPKIVAIAVLAVAALVVAFPLSVLGQGASRQSVFVAIPEVFPDVDARAVIIRERGQDVVLLREDEATPEALAMSLVVLSRVREQHPRPENGQMIPIVGFVLTSPLSEAYRARLVAMLARLERRPASTLGNLGRGRWVRYRSN